MEPLSDSCAESYLKFLKADKPTEPTLDYLDRLIRVHLERVTFENVDVLLQRRVSLDAETVLGKVTGRGRGGYCFELNSLFGRLLLALGYSLKPEGGPLAPHDSRRLGQTHAAVPHGPAGRAGRQRPLHRGRGHRAVRTAPGTARGR
ncbi:hypothetical protein HPB51_004705 [Rhipicephalus microplus]|uniref:arylamine N-acetyltransferase n=1 Tax=Rhipicephalus microplus TaxID=6941 RepID=A0A9J6DZQ3_RHIMP|nr:hypothetical protein HPB51_004705 [Rhipicephalus microplus]